MSCVFTIGTHHLGPALSGRRRSKRLAGRTVSVLLTSLLSAGAATAAVALIIPPCAAQQSSLSRRVDLGAKSGVPLCQRIGAIALALAEAPPSEVFYIYAVPPQYLAPPFEPIWTKLDAATLSDDQLERIAGDRHFFEARRALYPRYYATETDESSIERLAAAKGLAELVGARSEGRLFVEEASADLAATGETLRILHVGIAKSAGEPRERVLWSLHIFPTGQSGPETRLAQQIRRVLRQEIVSDIVRYGGRYYLTSFLGNARYFAINHGIVSLLPMCHGVRLVP